MRFCAMSNSSLLPSVQVCQAVVSNNSVVTDGAEQAATGLPLHRFVLNWKTSSVNKLHWKIPVHLSPTGTVQRTKCYAFSVDSCHGSVATCKDEMLRIMQ